jgi:hypothetical protein
MRPNRHHRLLNHRLAIHLSRPQNSVNLSRLSGRLDPRSKRARGGSYNERLPFIPPETWHEPDESSDGYKIVVQPPGDGYRHVLTPADVHARLGALPAPFVEPLQIVQFSRMTRKKQSFPCYGMQWGAAVYLYPIEQDLVEYYSEPPKPSQITEARMYGGRWIHESSRVWKLVWTERSIRDFYLNNILIHELGHLLDDRNARQVDRERFAEWFAVRYGYQPSRKRKRLKRSFKKRHHAK